MKKSLLLLSLTCLAGFTFAQTVSFGVKAGVNFSKLSASSGGVTASSSSTTGFHVGGVADIGFGDWSLQPGILYSTKGGSYGTSTDGVKLTLNYIEIPVNVLYNIPAGVGKVFIGGGPYFGWGVSGKGTVTGLGTSTGSGSETTNVTFGSGQNDTKNPDYGINILGGFRFQSGISLSAGYGIGLGNLSNDSSGSIKNNVLSFSAGYFF
jgi:hypothetical protein